MRPGWCRPGTGVFPEPSVIGIIISSISSTRSFLKSVWHRSALPITYISGPSCCFSSRTFSAMSPPRNTVGCQSLESRVFEATYFVAVMTFGQKFECFGHHGSQRSNVFRPNSRSTGFASRACTTAPVTSSAYGKNHPPT